MRGLFRKSSQEAFVCALCLCISSTAPAAANRITPPPAVLSFDFGPGPVTTGSVQVTATKAYVPGSYGWASGIGGLLERDRQEPDPLRRDFVMGRDPAEFQIDGLHPGEYTFTAVVGDEEYGDHFLSVSGEGLPANLPILNPARGEYAILTAPLVLRSMNGATTRSLRLRFSSPRRNWVVNALSVNAGKAMETTVTRVLSPMANLPASKRPVKDTWRDFSELPDPTAPLLEQFLVNQSGVKIEPTGLTRADYLHLTAGAVDYFKQHQDANGAIIDPYLRKEWQYSTPCFALAAATLAAHGRRSDLVEPASRAMDWACHTLRNRKAATAHEDFYPPQLAHALPLLKPYVAPERSARWEADLRSFNPFEVYRSRPGHGNWNVVAFSGEFLFYKLGIRTDLSFVEKSLVGQGQTFRSPLGLYLEGPMAYDHFPRIWAADMIAAGYKGKRAADLAEALRRAALTSLFMQSPNGELPLGGRSAHHQWNEAQQCLTYEIYAAEAKQDGDIPLAGAYKRAAHLALQSMRKWVRPSGELWIVKNRVDPEKRHGFEGYSAMSNYGLLPMAMLSIAYKHAGATEELQEAPAPCDVGGYVLKLDDALHKIFANARGHYLEIETAADLHYDATGLVRIHHSARDPRIGPSDVTTRHAWTNLPRETSTTAAIGPAWRDSRNEWHRLAQIGGSPRLKPTLQILEETPERVKLQVRYEGELRGPSSVTETYTLTPELLEIVADVERTSGSLQFVWPVFAYDGETSTTLDVKGNTVQVTAADGTAQEFSAPEALHVTVGEELYPNRNGWSRLAVAEFQNDGPMRILIRPLWK